MSDPMNPETLDDTVLMDGIVDSVAVESIGSPTVIFWITEAATGDQHQMNGSLLTDAVSRCSDSSTSMTCRTGRRPGTGTATGRRP